MNFYITKKLIFLSFLIQFIHSQIKNEHSEYLPYFIGYDSSQMKNNYYDEKFKSKQSLENKAINSYELSVLKKSVLYFYDRNTRPLKNSSKPVQVFMGVSVGQINKLDEAYQVMTSTLQLSIRWNDELIRWNSSIYSNSLSFKSNEIWVPDIIATNNVNNFKLDTDETYFIGNSYNIFDFNERNKYYILVSPNGDCRWVFPIKILSVCELNQEYFPFDFQECFIDFKSSAYLNDQLILKKFEDGIHLRLMNEGEFDLVKAEAIDSTSKTLFNIDYGNEMSVVRVKVFMKRKIVFYLNKIILPYFVFYIVVTLTHVLPVESGEKKSYSTSILFSTMIYLKDISSFIPKTNSMPMLSIYFNLNLIIIFLCIMITTIIYLVYYCGKTRRPLPLFLKKIVENSKYFKEKIFPINFVKNKKINGNLKKIDNYLNYSSLSKEKINIEYFLANDVLSLLKTLKMFIINQNLSDKHTIQILSHNFNLLNILETLKLSRINNKECKKKCTLQDKADSVIINKSDKKTKINYKNYVQKSELNKSLQKKIAFEYLHYLKEYKSQIKNNLGLNIFENDILSLKKSEYSYWKTSKEHPSLIQEWEFLAIIIDRIIFFFFCIFTSITLLIMFLRSFSF